jgi:hypothetical protein
MIFGLGEWIMKVLIIFGMAVIGGLCLVSLAFAEKDLIYGTVYTYDDDELEGFIRWDKNEASWGDVLDGNKDLKRRGRKDRSRDRYRDRDAREVKIFGITVYSDDYNWRWSGEAESGILMGHIETLIPDGDNEVILELKSGESVELHGGSGDIGSDNREILVDTEDEGIVELDWDDIDRIDFRQAPGRETQFGQRLYGTLVSRDGDEYTGFVCWDMDEIFDTDILDGHDKKRKRKIKFGKMESIERRSSSSALVTLKDGKKMRLSGTNDVDDSNRGILIMDKDLGRIEVSWDEFDYLEFKDPPEGPKYDSYDGGRLITGTVVTEDGDEFSGTIRWDDDEEYTWELLDGEINDIEFSIEFGNIESIEKSSRRGSLVVLRDGRKFRLRDSNDIDDDNKGIFVETDSGTELIEWDDFESVKFSH